MSVAAHSFWNECVHALLAHMVRIGSRKWSAAQVEHLTVLIDTGTSAARAAVVLKRSVVVVQAKARNLGKRFRLPPRVEGGRLRRKLDADVFLRYERRCPAQRSSRDPFQHK